MRRGIIVVAVVVHVVEVAVVMVHVYIYIRNGKELKKELMSNIKRPIKITLSSGHVLAI